MKIELNKVGIDIDGKVYNFYKLNFGFQRKLVELQSELNKLQNEIAKKYDIEPEAVSDSSKVSESEKLEVAKLGMSIQGTIADLMINQKEIDILDKLDGNNISQLIEALK